MNSFCVGFLAVLTVFSGNVLSKSTHDKFKQLFYAHSSFPRILAEVFDNDLAVQQQHFQTVQEHIDANDRYAPYAKHLKTAAEQVIQGTLRDVGYEGDDVDINEFLEASQTVESGEHLDNEELEQAIKELLERKQQLSEASEEEKNVKLGEIASKANIGDHSHEGQCQHHVQNVQKTEELEGDQEKEEHIEEEAPIRRSVPVSAQPSLEDDDTDN